MAQHPLADVPPDCSKRVLNVSIHRSALLGRPGNRVLISLNSPVDKIERRPPFGGKSSSTPPLDSERILIASLRLSQELIVLTVREAGKLLQCVSIKPKTSGCNRANNFSG